MEYDQSMIKFTSRKLLFGILLFVSGSNILAKTIHVGPTQAFHSIRSALAYSNHNDTVIVHHSQYKEGNIVINKRIFMLGDGWPVLDGQHKYEVVSIKADNVVFSGFQVQNSGISTLNDPGGIKVYDGTGLKRNFFVKIFSTGKNQAKAGKFFCDIHLYHIVQWRFCVSR